MLVKQGDERSFGSNLDLGICAKHGNNDAKLISNDTPKQSIR